MSNQPALGSNLAPATISPDIRHWERMVEMLSTGIVRISHAASGVDDRLDRRLSDLRKSVRAGLDPNSLERLIVEVSRAIIALDSKQSAAQKECASSAEALLKALDQLQPNWRLQRRRKAAAARLKSKSPDLPGFLRDYSEILASAVAEYDPSAADKGFLSRMLNKGGSSTPAPDPGAAEAMEDIRRALIRMLEHIDCSGELKRLTKRQRDRLTNTLDPTLLPDMLQAIADLAETAAGLQKKRFEEFAQKLAEQMANLQSVVSACADAEGESEANREQLESKINERTRSIQGHIGKAANLSELQRAVTLEVGGITKDLDSFREADQLRHKKFEASMDVLHARLGEAQAECNDLYSEIAKLRQRSQLDSLSGLPNRAAFMMRAQVEYERATRYGSPLSIAVVDIDHFKRINDSFGHRAGDTVIAELGSLIARNLRKSDFVCRYGGEEFVMLLPETTLDRAYQAAEKVRIAVSECPFAFRDRRVQLSVSIGVAELEPKQSISDLVEKADVALYEAKSAGRNRSMSSATH